jgi:hypothetical protein
LHESTRTSGLPYLCHLNFCGSRTWWLPHGLFLRSHTHIPMESKRKAERSKETTSLTEPIHRHTSLHPLIGGRSDTLPLALTATCPGTRALARPREHTHLHILEADGP